MIVIRFILGRLVLAIDFLTRKKPTQKSSDAINKQRSLTQNLAIYQFHACPFCVKVRRFMHQESLEIELRDAKNDVVYRKQLLEDGGKIQAPCLRIKNGQGDHTWIYESDVIIQYLAENVVVNDDVTTPAETSPAAGSTQK